jgi:hypothetical protein
MDAIETRTKIRDYMPQLDGLRAFADGALLFHELFEPARIGDLNFALLGIWSSSF